MRDTPEPGERVNPTLQRGREAYVERAWNDAYEALTTAAQTAVLAAEDVERLAWAAGLSGHLDEFFAAMERLHHLHLQAGEPRRAARAAFWIGFRLLGLGEIARGTGWLGRAERLVEPDAESPEHGYLLLPVAQRHFMADELEAAYAVAARAVVIGERFGDRDLTEFARGVQGRALVRQGRLREGLARLDEVMVAATSDELSTVFTGLLYCMVIECCRTVYALDRAQEWTQALTDWCELQPQLAPFTGECRVRRAEILALRGEWTEAIAEAERAAETFQRTEPSGTGEAIYQRAELYRLRGDFGAADDAYREASRLGREPQPGLSLLRLAQGKTDLAVQGILRALESVTDRLQRARFLPAGVEILIAAKDCEQAQRAAAELTEIASHFDAEVLRAMAAHARGAVQLAEGDTRGALAPLREAFAIWQRIGAPYLAARVRVLVAEACNAVGDRDGAELERTAAAAVFDGLGARPDLHRLDALERRGREARRHGLTARELEVLRLVAGGATNKAIAKQLFLSEKTIDRHVSNIFGKLAVSTRAAATAFAYQHDLI